MPLIEAASSGKAASLLTMETSLQPHLPTGIFLILHFSQEGLPKLHMFEFQSCVSTLDYSLQV